MNIIVKLIGVPSSKIGLLHQLLAQGVYKEEFESRWHRDKGPEIKRVDWAKIIRAKSEDGEKYVVDIELITSLGVRNPSDQTPGLYTIFPSIEKLRLIFDVLGIYPDEQKMICAS